MGAEYVYKEMKGTIGFKITPTEIKIKQKFSQNRDDKNYQQIIDNLNKSHNTNDKKMAEKMADLRKSNGCFGDDHIII